MWRSLNTKPTLSRAAKESRGGTESVKTGTRNVHECLVGGEPSPSNVPRASDKVSEMLKLREDLAKDVSICDNANEVRAVYRWNPEHDNIGI